MYERINVLAGVEGEVRMPCGVCGNSMRAQDITFTPAPHTGGWGYCSMACARAVAEGEPAPCGGGPSRGGCRWTACGHCPCPNFPPKASKAEPENKPLGRMFIREGLAVEALKGMLAAGCHGPCGPWQPELVDAAYRYADAMLKAREEVSDGA